MSAATKKTKRALPAGWRWCRLGDVCEVNPRRPALSRADDEPTSFVPMEAVDAVFGTISDRRFRPYGEIKKGYTWFAENDVLFAKITPCMQNGKHAVARGLSDGFGFGTTEFHVLRSGQYITEDWIWSFLRRPEILQEATEQFTGSVGQQRLPDDYLKALEIPLPPLPEQQRIAAILKEQMAAVDKARTAAEARLDAVKALPAAYLREVFCCNEERHWKRHVLESVAKTCSGSTPSRSRKDYFLGSIPWVKTGELKDNTIVDTEEHVSEAALQGTSIALLPVDTLLIAMYGQGQTRGRTALLAKPSTTNQACFAVLPNKDAFVPLFLQFWFMHNYSRLRTETEARGGNQPNFNGDYLKKQLIPLPSLSDQRRLAACLREQMTAAEQARAAAEAELDAINALPAALLRRAFNGGL